MFQIIRRGARNTQHEWFTSKSLKLNFQNNLSEERWNEKTEPEQLILHIWPQSAFLVLVNAGQCVALFKWIDMNSVVILSYRKYLKAEWSHSDLSSLCSSNKGRRWKNQTFLHFSPSEVLKPWLTSRTPQTKDWFDFDPPQEDHFLFLYIGCK